MLSREALTFCAALTLSGFPVTVFHDVHLSHISLPSFIFHPLPLPLSLIGARGGAELLCVCHWLPGQLVEETMSLFTSVITQGP